MKKLLFLSMILASTLLVSCGNEATDAKAAGTVAEGEGAEFAINAAESTVKWTGRKIGMYSHTGTIGVKDGSFAVADGKVTGGSMTIDMTAMDVEMDDNLMGEGKKDYFLGHLAGDDFFAVEQYPTSTFNVTKLEGGKIFGNLKIKDVEKEIAIPAEVNVDGDKMTANGKVTINRADFNVKWGSNSFPDMIVNDIIVDDNIDFEFQLVGAKK